MPTTYTYQYLYDFYTTLPDASSTYPSSFAFETTISDNADGSVDGQTVVLGKVDWSAYGSDETLWGFTDRGDPIVGHIGGRYFVLSNNPSLTGNLGFTTTGVFDYSGPIHSQPSGSDGTARIGEDGSHIFATSDFGFSDSDDEPADDFAAVVITTLPSAGVLTLNGVALSAGDVVTVADITAGNLVFTPAANESGDDYASFTFQVRDSHAGTDIENTDQTPNTFTFDVTPINDAPEGTDGSATIDEDGSHTFSQSDFGFSDPDDTPADDFAGVVITTLPSAGALTLNGVAVSAGDMISAADIAAGHLVFTPGANESGDDYASFTFQVVDDAVVLPNFIIENVLPKGWNSPHTGSAILDLQGNPFVRGGRIESDSAAQPDAIATTGETYTLDFNHRAISGFANGPFKAEIYAGTTKIGEQIFTPVLASNPDQGIEPFSLMSSAVPPEEAGNALRVYFTREDVPGANSAFHIDDVSLALTSVGPNLLINGDFTIDPNGENTDQ